jgi:hypothetical protein
MVGWCMSVFLNRQATAWYQALASILPGPCPVKKNLPSRGLTKVENHWCMRRIHKRSFICQYCRRSTVVTMMRMCAEFVGPFGRHGHHLQTIRVPLRIVLCVYNVQENREACHMLNAVCNPFLECKKHKTDWHSSSTLWRVWRTWHEWFNGKDMGETL